MSKSICKHLERYLPQMGKGKIPFVTSSLFNIKEDPVFNQSSQSVEEFIDTVKEYGILDSWDQELLVAYFVDGKSTYQIAAENHYVGKETVRKHINKLKQLLKERGYGKGKVRA